MEITGRLDTLSAPELLADFENITENFGNVVVDLARVPYIVIGRVESIAAYA